MALAVNENDPDDPFTMKGTLGVCIIRNPDPNEVMMDIWFVHGLFGNREGTWTHKNGTFWPKLLADDFPKARVITYGYDASVAKFSKLWKGVDKSGLEDYGKGLAYAVRDSRQATEGGKPIPALDVPIYFIGHSLGGLVIEQTLLESLGSDESLYPIRMRTAGVMFMGTPHQGSSLAFWARKLRDALRFLLPIWYKNTNGELLKLLEERSEVCKNVQRRFQLEGRTGKLKGLKLFCFYETVPMVAGNLVVKKESAVLSISHSDSITGTHSEMVKFEGKADAGYQKVVGQFREWTKNALQADQVKEGGTLVDPEKLGDEQGENVQKRKKPTKSAIAYGARIGSISDVQGGVINLQTQAVGGDFFDMRYAKGKAYGKVVYMTPVDDVNDQLGESDQFSNCDEEDEGTENA